MVVRSVRSRNLSLSPSFCNLPEMSKGRHTIYAFARTLRDDANFRKTRFFTDRPSFVLVMFLTTNYRFIVVMEVCSVASGFRL